MTLRRRRLIVYLISGSTLFPDLSTRSVQAPAPQYASGVSMGPHACNFSYALGRNIA